MIYLFIYEFIYGYKGKKETHTLKSRPYQGIPSPHTLISDLSS